MEFILFVLFWAVVFGAISAAIGQRKNINGAFWWGFFLGIIGLIVVIAKAPGLPPAPLGTYATTCPRCNAVQNIPYAATVFDCWQCHLQTPLPTRAAPLPPPPKPQPKTQPKPLPEGKVRVECPLCGAKLIASTTAKKIRCAKCREVSPLTVTPPPGN